MGEGDEAASNILPKMTPTQLAIATVSLPFVVGTIWLLVSGVFLGQEGGAAMGYYGIGFKALGFAMVLGILLLILWLAEQILLSVVDEEE